MGLGINNFSAKLAEHYGNGFSADEFKSRIMKYNDEYIYGNKIKPMKGAYELLDYLQSINKPMCVATSSKRKIAETVLTNLDLIKYFDYLVCEEEVNNAKPDPEIYIKARKNHNKDEVLIFKDGHAGALAAFRCGASVIMIPCVA